MNSYLHSLLFHIYAIELLGIPNKFLILNQLKKFYVKQMTKNFLLVLEQLFLLVLVPYKENKDNIIINLYNKLKQGNTL
jgi:selenocysteine-specific translation elongation factor